MSKLRRFTDSRTTYFVTNVTYDRQPVLVEHSDLLWKTLATLQLRTPIEIQSWVLLPDHLHMVLDTKGISISNVLQRLKMGFTAHYLKRIGAKSGRVWQNRFWDHIIRDQRDWNNHVDYIHYNPTKHGYVNSPFDWQHSSIHMFREGGFYSMDWGNRALMLEGDFGE